jgi:cbb3-type cytochrome oxidase subunit 3
MRFHFLSVRFYFEALRGVIMAVFWIFGKGKKREMKKEKNEKKD